MNSPNSNNQTTQQSQYSHLNLDVREDRMYTLMKD
mgnify:CR=1 FL=1|jgi:hypothetical protein